MIYKKSNIKGGIIAAVFFSTCSFAAVSAQNVGIGTTTPNSKLSVKGGLSVGTNYADTATAPTNGAAFQGSVGIGTSNPQKPLDIATAGGIRISRTDSISSNNEIFFQDYGQIRSVDNNHRIIFDRGNNLFEIREYGDIIMSPGSTSGTRTQKVTFKSNGDVSISNLGSGLVKSTSGILANATAGTDYQAPMSAGTGIGISSNTISNTGVTGLSGTAGQINVSGSTGSVTISLSTAGSSGTYTKVSTDAYGRVTSGTGLSSGDIPSGSGYYIQNTTSQQGSSNFNISGNGIVGGSMGVGVSPSYKLDVNGDIRGGVYRTTLANGNIYQLGDDAWLTDVNTANTIALEGSSNSAVGALQLGTNANSYIYGSGGSIGIRTTATTQDFNVGGRMYIANGVIQTGNGGAVTGTSDLGLYSTTSGNWIRIVSNQAPIKFFTDQNTTSTGGTEQFSILADGTLTSTKNESAGTYLLPDAFCVVVNLSSSCPTNWDQRDIKWDTADTYNADYGKDGKIAEDAGNSSSIHMRFCCRGSGW